MMEPQTTPNTASIVETAFTWPKGFYSDGLHAGLKAEKPDLGWLFSKVPASAAGVYTTNQFCAAPTALTKKRSIMIISCRESSLTVRLPIPARVPKVSWML